MKCYCVKATGFFLFVLFALTAAKKNDSHTFGSGGDPISIPANDTALNAAYDVLLNFTTEANIVKTVKFVAASSEDGKTLLVAVAGLSNAAISCVQRQYKSVPEPEYNFSNAALLNALASGVCASYATLLQPVSKAISTTNATVIISSLNLTQGLPVRYADAFIRYHAGFITFSPSPALQELFRSLVSVIANLSTTEKQTISTAWPFLGPVFLTNGTYYKAFNVFINELEHGLNNQTVNETAIQIAGLELESFNIHVVPGILDFLQHRLDAFTTPKALANDTALESLGQRLSTLLLQIIGSMMQTSGNRRIS